MRNAQPLYTTQHADALTVGGDCAIVSRIRSESDCGYLYSFDRARDHAGGVAEGAKKKADTEVRA